MRTRRRRRNRRATVVSVLLVSGGVACAWWIDRAGRATTDFDPTLTLATQSRSVVDPPAESAPSSPPVRAADVAVPEPTSPAPEPRAIERQERSAASTIETPAPENPPALEQLAALIERGRQALEGGDLVAARTIWNEVLRRDPNTEQETSLRAELERLAAQTILSSRILAGDPFVQRYVIQPGDVLAKIAAAAKVTPDLLASVNGIADKNQIREGQAIKVVSGPFRAVVHKHSYTLDIYLGDTFLREFRVGLGADDSTPTGEWRVATKLVNPTYYPPRGGDIVAADDPNNPLGERWIGLVGVSGNALDQQRYGIHGTNEPDSIGKNRSMGCIRLRNEDVEQLYTYLVEQHSTVSVTP